MERRRETLDRLAAPLKGFAVHVVGACRDLVPIIGVICIFQLLVLRQPFAQVVDVFVGLVFVILGLALFVLGLRPGSSQSVRLWQKRLPKNRGP